MAEGSKAIWNHVNSSRNQLESLVESLLESQDSRIWNPRIHFCSSISSYITSPVMLRSLYNKQESLESSQDSTVIPKYIDEN